MSVRSFDIVVEASASRRKTPRGYSTKTGVSTGVLPLPVFTNELRLL